MTGTINFDQIRQYANTIRQRETAQATGTIFGQAGTPDQAVEALTLGRELSLPPAAILAQPDRFRSEVAMQRATALLENSPALQQWIVSDPLNGQLASDDLDPLAGYEAFVARAEESLGDLFTRRGQEVVQGVSGVIEAVPMRRAINAVALERRIIEQADAWVAEAGRQAQSFREILEAGLDPMSGTPLTEEDRALYEQRLAEAEEGLQNWTDMAESGVMPIEMRTMMQISQSISDWVDDTFGVPPADDSIWSQLAYGTGSMIGFALPSMLPGGVIATAQLGADAAATEAYQRAIQSGASERDAEVAANIMGFLGTSEALPIASALRAIPSPLRNRVIGRIGRVISESAVGSIEEAVQEGFTAVAQNLTARGLYDPEQGIMEDVGAQMLVGAILGGFMSGGFELVSPGPSDGPLSPELQRMQNTGRTAAHLEALDAQVGAVATRERSPERFEQFAAEAGGDRDLYVPAEELRVYAQDANLDLDRLGVDAVEMDTMAQTGGMVAIPEARYAAYVSGTDAAQWFHENSVLNPDTEMSLAQQAAIGRSLTDAAMEDARRIREGDRQLRTSDQQVFDRVRAQLREAGRSPDVAENEATFFAAFFRTMAERYGADTLELYERFGVRIERAVSTSSESGVLSGVQTTDKADVSGQTLQQAAQTMQRTPEFQQWFGQSAVVDEAGAPLVVYHGTNADVDADFAFDPDLSVGSFMGDDGNIAPIFLTSDRPYAERLGQNIVEAYVSIQNPLRVDVLEMGREEASNAGMPLPETVAEAEQILGSYDQILEALYMSGELDGHDGVIFTETDDSIGRGADQIVVFDPSQIKSIFNPRPTSDPRVMYQFAGPQSQTADIHALARAKDMIEDGSPPDVVRRETGWFKGVDGRWRYEITDEDASISDAIDQGVVPPLALSGEPTFNENDVAAVEARQAEIDEWWQDYENLFSESGIPLSDILDHERMYAAYPDLKIIPVFFDRSLDAKGMVTVSGAQMTLNPDQMSDYGDMLSTILHEAQHLIQRREGFARGGSLEITAQVKQAVERLVVARDQDVEGWLWQNADKVRDADAKQALAAYASMYKSYEALVNYANSPRPSSVFRLIRNEAGWLYSDTLQNAQDQQLAYRARELSRTLYSLPPRHRMADRNRFLSEYAFGLAQVLKDAVPPTVWKQFSSDERTLNSMVRAYEREASRARLELRPLQQAKQRLARSRDLLDATKYKSPYEVYRALAGEAEARNTQARADMTTEERASTPPSRTADISEAEQIVVFPDGEIEAPSIANIDPHPPRVLNQDNGDTGPRGQIEIPAAGVDAGTTVIKLFDGADLSTVIHESGHYFYEVFATLASDPRAPEQMKADLAALQEWAGVEPGKAPSVEALENIARGMERYTLEGKAPSVELASVFGRFKAWLLRVYQTVKQRRLNVKLTPEVREVFDRMLATDAEIAQARDLAGDSALLKSAPPGMSEATWAAYQRLQRQKVERAEQTLLERTMAAVRRRKEAWWKDERATRVQDEMDRLGNQPEYRVIRAFADGDWAGVEGAVEGADLRLDRAALEEMFGEGITNDLAPAKFGMSRAIYTTAKHPDGMHPSEAAELFGFTSASEMIDALRGAGNRRAIAEATVDQAMAQEYGDPFADGSIEAEALDAVHNDRKGEAMALELRYIAERLGRDGRREQTASFKARARAIIGGLTVQQATKPAHFLQAERQASRRAQEAFAAGRLEEAYQAKEQEALNHYLFVEATKVEKLVARKREQMRNYDRADVRQKVGPREMEQIDAILQDYEFRKRTQRALDRTMSLRQYIEKMTEEGREAELMLDADLLDEVRRQHYSRLSVDELMAVFDAVDNLDNLGRTKTDIRNGLDKIKLRKAAATVAQQIRDNFGTGRRGKESRLRSTMNLLWTADTILVEMDGTDEYGEAYRLIKEALDAGQSREQQMHVELAQRLEDLFSVYSQEDLTEMRKQRHVSGADARAWSKLEIISLALNMGNADNIQRVLSEDINKDFRLNRDQVDALLDTLDKRDWDFVQSMWDQIDSYWPEIQAVTTRRTGVKPRKVEATPVQTRFGVYRGGYYPIAYDPSSSGRSSVDAVTATDQFMSAGRYGKAQTAHGHTIARKQNSNGRALLFDLNVAFRHMRDVVRDIALSEAVDGAYRILNDEEVHSAFIEAGRENDFRVLNLWLKDLARGPIYNTDSLNSAARFIKNNFTLSRLAFNLKTAILQITGIGQSAATVGKRAMVEGYAEYLKRPHEMAQEVTQLSPFMAERQSTFQKDIYDFANDVKLASPLASRWHKTKNKVSQWGFAPMMWAQFYAVDMPTWIAGYRSGLERFGNEEQAVRYADRMVARSQDSGLFGDRAAMSRGTMSETTRQSDFIRLFTTLAGYMMTKLNRANLTVRRGVKGMREGATIEEQASAAFNMAADLALLYVTEAAMMALMYSLILDDEDEPDYAAFFGREVSAAIFGGLPFVRDAAAAFTGFGGGGVYGSVGELPYRVWQQTVNQDWENDAALRRAIGDLVGTTTGLPTTASLRLIEGVVNEDDRPFAEALVGRNQLTR